MTEAGGVRGIDAPVLAAFLAGGSAVDNVDLAPSRLPPQINLVSPVNVDNNTLFPLGTTAVIFRFQDASGNIGTALSSVQVVGGSPRLAGSIAARGRDTSGTYFVDLQLSNSGTAHARNINLTALAFRTLAGTGTVTLGGPALPAAVGSLNIGAATTIRLFLNMPVTVTRFFIAEGGTMQDVTGANYSFSLGQAVDPIRERKRTPGNSQPLVPILNVAKGWDNENTTL